MGWLSASEMLVGFGVGRGQPQGRKWDLECGNPHLCKECAAIAAAGYNSDGGSSSSFQSVVDQVQDGYDSDGASSSTFQTTVDDEPQTTVEDDVESIATNTSKVDDEHFYGPERVTSWDMLAPEAKKQVRFTL